MRESRSHQHRPPSATRAGGHDHRGHHEDGRGRGSSLVDGVRRAAEPGKTELAVRYFDEGRRLLERDRPEAAVRAAQRAKAVAARSTAVRELLGIALYSAGDYPAALRELLAYRRMTGRLDQNHLIADCYRAIGQPEKAVQPAREAIHARIPREARAEAAIVGASALADLGRYDEALALLRSVRGSSDRGHPHDLRVWYVAGSVLARAGRREEAAEEFRRILRFDAGAFDAAERLAAL